MKNYYDIIVVGAGPAGSVAARYAARHGVSVLLLEKDRDVGYPVRCGEAVNKSRITEFIDPDEKWICAHINKFRFVAPNDKEVTLQFREEGYILERRIFDYQLAKLASEEGAEVVTRAYVNGLIIDEDSVRGVKALIRGEEIKIKSKIVIAADGVESRVGRWAGLKTHIDFRDMESCVQVTASNINNINPDTCYFYFGENVAPSGYFWIFPKGNHIANIGLGVSGIIGKKKSALKYFNQFMERRYPDAPFLTSIAGGVPCSVTLKKISSNGIILTGDAARQVNPLTGGGISSGMIGGSIAGDIAGHSIKRNTTDYLSKYPELWYQQVGKKHEIYNRIKNGIYNFTDDKFNKIADSVLKLPEDKRTLRNVFTTALINQPSLLLDVAKVFIY
ncbi:MAG: NAD(P)/FAD-dependent oxidoreductase [Ignavibacteriaceae bacterium]|jgi:digeranylgeranylglycerophospholipid reductase|nr:NAD(P)/FAD-dependent oxidoreductase [Ignavibacteriaceae bacterium]